MGGGCIIALAKSPSLVNSRSPSESRSSRPTGKTRTPYVPDQLRDAAAAFFILERRHHPAWLVQQQIHPASAGGSFAGYGDEVPVRIRTVPQLGGMPIDPHFPCAMRSSALRLEATPRSDSNFCNRVKAISRFSVLF